MTSHDRPAGQPSRIAAARARASHTRRVVGVAAAAVFGLALVLARAAHPASTGAALTTPPALAAEVQGATLGGGSIASASGPAVAATATS